MSKLSDFLEFSPFDNKVSSDFLKEIPNIVIEPDGRIDKEKAFWDKFFVEYSIDQYDNTIRAIGEVLIDSNKHYILFIGTSGSGKTTFLNYLVKYKDEYFKNDIQIDLINLIKDPSCAGIGPEIIHDSLDEKIVQYLNREVVAEIARYYVLYLSLIHI